MTGRLLVVNDEPDNRDFLALRLSRHGYEVQTAGDGLAALAAVEQQAFDLVLLDIRMPNMDGLEVLQRLRAKYTMFELPVVMASAQTESASVVRALSLGANDYITEPIDFAVALARIQSHLRTAAAAHAPSQPPSSSLHIGVGRVLDGRYRIEGVLGRGGFAVVYHGVQLSTGQRVAIKVLQTQHESEGEARSVDRQRFELEMRLIGEINHPSVVRLLDSGTVEVSGESPPTVPATPANPGGETPASGERGRQTAAAERLPYLVMELLQGETLHGMLARRSALPVSEAVDLLVPVISGVGAAHHRGAVHRDLKPANIFLAESGGQVQPKVLDFGIAKLADEARHGLTQTAAVIGTPEYMAPEQAQGVRVDHRSDQFTLTSVLFECITGQRAFVGGSMIDVIRRVADGQFPDLGCYPELPEGLAAVMARAAALAPDDRYPTVEDLGLHLLPFASESVRAQWEVPLQSGAARLHRARDADMEIAAGFAEADTMAMQAPQQAPRTRRE